MARRQISRTKERLRSDRPGLAHRSAMTWRSARNPPLNDSMNELSVGFPDCEKSSVTLRESPGAKDCSTELLGIGARRLSVTRRMSATRPGSPFQCVSVCTDHISFRHAAVVLRRRLPTRDMP